MTVSTPERPATSMSPLRYGVNTFRQRPRMTDISRTQCLSAHSLMGTGLRHFMAERSPFENRVLTTSAFSGCSATRRLKSSLYFPLRRQESEETQPAFAFFPSRTRPHQNASTLPGHRTS